MSEWVDTESKRALASKIHYWAQDILRQNATCGLGKSLEGRYVVIWPGLIDHWLSCPEEHGEYLGTLDRESDCDDIEKLLPNEEKSDETPA